MSGATLTSPPAVTERFVVDTDVASFISKWHPKFGPLYVSILHGAELVISFMTVAEMRKGALDANWGPRKCDVLGSESVPLTRGSQLRPWWWLDRHPERRHECQRGTYECVRHDCFRHIGKLQIVSAAA